MRIDKYLWCVRYYKTRSIATEACKKNQVTVNGQVAKPSREVFPSDTIRLRLHQINYQMQVIGIPANRVGAKLVDLYRRDETAPEELERLKMIRESREVYTKFGTGKPSKKDRRDLEDYIEGNEFDEDDTI
jgi:ribosome-associated heat shock protein Hsp15